MKNLFYKNLADNTVLCLIAPTASGKTKLACHLHETGRFELISVDSALIYQDMNIGTAKPSAKELEQYPHHLVNIIKPTQCYSVANFVADVKAIIKTCHENGKIPLLVGGTMMYYMALFVGLSPVPETDWQIRQKVLDWHKQQGIAELYAYLKAHDPVICQRLKISDTQRITRAVEVLLQTGTPMSVWQNMPKVALCHHKEQSWIGISVEPDRAWLHERIQERLDLMWQAGLVDEVIGLLATYPDLHADLPSMRCVGYRQVLEYLALICHPVMQMNTYWADFSEKVLSDELFLDKSIKTRPNGRINTPKMYCLQMKNKALYATRQLAKRQATWQRQLRLNWEPKIIDMMPDKASLCHFPIIISSDTMNIVENNLLLNKHSK